MAPVMEYKHAECVEDGPYEIKEIQAPIVTGVPLRLFVMLSDSYLFPPIRTHLMRKNGFIPHLVESTYPDNPTFVPSLPEEALEPFADKTEVIEDRSPLQRANICRKLGLASPPSGSICYPTVADYHEAYKSGTVTPSEVAERIIATVRSHESQSDRMRMFIQFNEADIRAQAAGSTQRYKSGEPLSILDGVPYNVKDTIDAMPYVTTEGTLYVAKSHKVTQDSVFVARLRELGAVLLGKANMHESGMGTTGANTCWGTPRNPHDTRRHTGGSSSGSAAAVAAGLCPFALGTDGGGSVRIPAALCGVVGLKPTHARLAFRHTDKPQHYSSVMVFGPLACSVRDAALLYALLANNGAEKSPLPPLRLPNLPPVLPAKSLAGKQVAVYWKWFEDASAEVVKSCKAALRVMEEQGAEIVSVNIPELHLLQVAHACTIASDHRADAVMAVEDAATLNGMSPDVHLLMRVADGYSSLMYLQAQRVRTRMTHHFLRVLRSADFIATPTTPITAPLINTAGLQGGESNIPQTVRLMRYALAPNFTGLPAISIPVGEGDESGMPVGLQLIGPPWSEASLLYAGAAIEQHYRSSVHAPPVFINPLQKIPL